MKEEQKISWKDLSDGIKAMLILGTFAGIMSLLGWLIILITSFFIR